MKYLRRLWWLRNVVYWMVRHNAFLVITTKDDDMKHLYLGYQSGSEMEARVLLAHMNEGMHQMWGMDRALAQAHHIIRNHR